MIVHARPVEVANRLKERFDWFEAAFVLAVQQGYIERTNCAIPFDPPTAPGTDAWRYTLRSLRQQADARGWTLSDPGNLSVITSEKLEVNIVVFSGDDATGLPHLTPKSKNPRGPMIKEAVRRNYGELSLFEEVIEDAGPDIEEMVRFETWVLLTHITNEEIRAELSLPKSVDEHDRVDDWAERIIINVPLPGAESEDVPDADSDPDIVPAVSFNF
jgi:hypothetical protein